MGLREKGGGGGGGGMVVRLRKGWGEGVGNCLVEWCWRDRGRVCWDGIIVCCWEGLESWSDYAWYEPMI